MREESKMYTCDMTIARRYDGQPIIGVELDTDVMLDISITARAATA